MVSIDLRFAAPATGPVALSPTVPAAAGGGARPSSIISKSMLRPRDESLAKTLSRVRMLCAPARPKAGRRFTPDEILAMCPPAVLLDAEGQPLDEQALNSDVWERADTLLLGDAKIRVKYNLPTITGVTAPSVVYAGLPAVVTGINILFGASLPLESEWRLGKADGSAADESVPPLAENTFVLTPKKEWAGRKLFFRCRVKMDDSLWTEVETPAVVADAAGFGPVARIEQLAIKKPPQFRIVSYNVLHDSYANSKAALTKIYPFCTKEVLALTYRRARIAQELQAYDGDIICLQECGRDVYNRYFSEIFKHWGYGSHLAIKTGSTKEGCCIAYRSDRFELIGDRPTIVQLSWGTLKTKHPDVATEIAAEHPHLLVGLKKVPSIGVFVALRDKMTGKAVVVSNTHLYYHPNGCHIRALQFFIFMSAVQEHAATIEGGAEIVAPGDYNFSRTTGGYRLATTGAVLPDDTCWHKGLKHYWGMDRAQTGAVAAAVAEAEGAVDDAAGDEEYDVTDLITPSDHPAVISGASTVSEVQDATSNFASKLQSPPTTCFTPKLHLPRGPLIDLHPTDDDMRFTNYALTFKECIDHIFVSRGVRRVATLPQPSEAQLAKDIAIPSLTFPSDHIALVTDLEFA
jgi:2',5'-phosphodiesterase